MTGPDEFSIPVTVQVPRMMYARLSGVARRHSVDISALMVELARRGLLSKVSTVRPRTRPKVSARGPQRVWSEHDDAELLRLYAEGKSDTAIARELGWSQGTVGNHRDARGLPPLFAGRPKKVRDEGVSDG